MAIVHNAVLLLSFAIAVQECNGIPKRIKYILKPPCLDLLIVERMTQRISKDVTGADHNNILLKSSTFDKICRNKYLHSCVLERIIEFYENVLSNDQHIKAYHLDLISTLEKVRNCTYKVKRCEKLYEQANNQPAALEIAEADMSAQEVAIFQLQKLNHATEMFNHTTVRETAMDELKSLHHYILGKAFRKSNG